MRDELEDREILFRMRPSLKTLAYVCWAVSLVLLGVAVYEARLGWTRGAIQFGLQTFVYLGLGYVFWLSSRNVVITITPHHIACAQPRANAPTTVEFDSFRGLLWDNPSAICLELKDGTGFVVSLHGLNKGQKAEVRRLLASRLDFYEAT